MKNIFKSTVAMLSVLVAFTSCNNTTQSNKKSGALASNAAEKVYVAPGEHDEFYAFISGGFSGQLAVYGLPSGRLFKVIPVFSQDAEKAYGSFLRPSVDDCRNGDGYHYERTDHLEELLVERVVAHDVGDVVVPCVVAANHSEAPSVDRVHGCDHE